LKADIKGTNPKLIVEFNKKNKYKKFINVDEEMIVARQSFIDYLDIEDYEVYRNLKN